MELITPQLVRTVIEQRFKVAQLPLNLELRDCNLNDGDLLQLRSLLNKTFSKDAEVKHNDTVYTLTDKLLAA